MFVVGDLAGLGGILGCFVIVRWISTNPLGTTAQKSPMLIAHIKKKTEPPDRPVSVTCPFAPCRKTAQNSKKAGLRADLVAGWPHVAHSRGFLSVEAEFSPISGRL